LCWHNPAVDIRSRRPCIDAFNGIAGLQRRSGFSFHQPHNRSPQSPCLNSTAPRRNNCCAVISKCVPTRVRMQRRLLRPAALPRRPRPTTQRCDAIDRHDFESFTPVVLFVFIAFVGFFCFVLLLLLWLPVILLLYIDHIISVSFIFSLFFFVICLFLAHRQ
jgi:hypothetical protein